jgi:ABC-type transport system involved in multi-copper enzyme maturation permease subunit
MIGIIRKDAVVYTAYIAMFTAVQAYAYLFSSFGHLAYTVTVFAFLCFIVSTLPAVSNEYTEKINRGYAFIKTLPVTDGEVVASKFLLLLVSTALYTAITMICLRFLPATPRELGLARAALLLNASAGLALAGIFFILVYRFGLSTLMTVLSVGLGGVVAGYIATAEMLARGRFDHLLPVLESIAGIGWPVIAAAGIVAWFVLMRLSLHMKRKHHEERD